MEAKDTKKLAKIAKANSERERAIAKEWLAFSKTQAWDDFQRYGRSTSDMLTSYAKEMVMPSPVKDGEEIILTVEKAHSLLQNARGCDIVLSYAEQYIESATKK